MDTLDMYGVSAYLTGRGVTPALGKYRHPPCEVRTGYAYGTAYREECVGIPTPPLPVRYTHCGCMACFHREGLVCIDIVQVHGNACLGILERGNR